jgi:hypothetical protein
MSTRAFDVLCESCGFRRHYERQAGDVSCFDELDKARVLLQHKAVHRKYCTAAHVYIICQTAAITAVTPVRRQVTINERTRD